MTDSKDCWLSITKEGEEIVIDFHGINIKTGGRTTIYAQKDVNVTIKNANVDFEVKGGMTQSVAYNEDGMPYLPQL